MNKNVPVMVVMLVLIAIAVWFAVQGSVMHSEVLVEEGKFHALLADYFNNSKAVRDAAATGEPLTQDLIELQQYPSDLLRLKLVGIGQILTGIFVLLLGILIALIMMPIRLGQIIKGE